jgi:hypothetical protein
MGIATIMSDMLDKILAVKPLGVRPRPTAAAARRRHGKRSRPARAGTAALKRYCASISPPVSQHHRRNKKGVAIEGVMQRRLPPVISPPAMQRMGRPAYH